MKNDIIHAITGGEIHRSPGESLESGLSKRDQGVNGKAGSRFAFRVRMCGA